MSDDTIKKDEQGVGQFESTEEILKAVSRIIDSKGGAPSTPKQPPAQSPPQAPAQPPSQTKSAFRPPVSSSAPSAAPQAPAQVPPQGSVFRTGARTKPESLIPQKKGFRAHTPQPAAQAVPPQVPRVQAPVTPTPSPAPPPPPQQAVPPVPQAPPKAPPPVPEVAPVKKPDIPAPLELTDMIDDNGTIIPLPLLGGQKGQAMEEPPSHQENNDERAGSFLQKKRAQLSHLLAATKSKLLHPSSHKDDDVRHLAQEATKDLLAKEMTPLIEQAVERALNEKKKRDSS